MKNNASISIHLNENFDEFKKYRKVLNDWCFREDLKGKGIEVCHAITPYKILQKYGMNLKVIKHIQSLGKTNRSFYRYGDISDIERMLNYIKERKGVAVFLGEIEVDSKLHQEFMMAIEKEVEILELK